MAVQPLAEKKRPSVGVTLGADPCTSKGRGEPFERVKIEFYEIKIIRMQILVNSYLKYSF
jgi:hypothetical protein